MALPEIEINCKDAVAKRVLWHKDKQGHCGWEQSRCRTTGGWLMAMVSQAAGNDVFSVNGWVNWSCWWTKINLVISTSYAKFISRDINLNMKGRQLRRVSQWPVAALSTQRNTALIFTFRLELSKTPGTFTKHWPGRHIYHTQITKASKAMRK